MTNQDKELLRMCESIKWGRKDTEHEIKNNDDLNNKYFKTVLILEKMVSQVT